MQRNVQGNKQKDEEKERNKEMVGLFLLLPLGA
jgi:hypothetical protein